MTLIISIPIFAIGWILCQKVTSFTPAINNARSTFHTSNRNQKDPIVTEYLYNQQQTDSCQAQSNPQLLLLDNHQSRYRRRSYHGSFVLHSSSSSSVTEDEFVQAKDFEALQILFNKYCDKEGLMTKATALNVPAIAELIADDNLLPKEFDEIWNRVPKFPETDSTKTTEERIDVDSWVQLYRDIDDLFEEDDNDNDTSNVSTTTVPIQQNTNNDSIQVTENNNKNGIANFVTENNNENNDDDDAIDLKTEFERIATKSNKVSKSTLYKWNEIQDLLSDGLVSIEELDGIWEKTTPKVGKKKNQLDINGFLTFNSLLDSLFEFDDLSDDDDDEEDGVDDYEGEDDKVTTAVKNNEFVRRMVQGDDLDPDTLFAALCNPDGLVGKEELKLWSELQEMLASGDLLPSELDNIYAINAKADGDKLDEQAFVQLYQSINDLFDDNFEGDDTNEANRNIAANDELSQESLKKELLSAIEDLDEEDKLPCGLDADDRERKFIMSIVEDLEVNDGNLIRQRRGAIEPDDLAGDWELIYSSSSAMRFNKGLSGLGGSFPNGKFGNLVQKLRASKFLMDVEYVEHIQVVPSTASFDVTVNGSWDLRSSVSLFTGEPSIILTVEPNRVTYGPTSTRADHWKSLGPMNMLDLSYLDDTIRIMRGNTSIETIFIFRRKQ